MKISLITPTRNNLKYLKWSYRSVRENNPNIDIEYCVAADFCNDGTVDWCKDTAIIDKNFKWIENPGPARLGHTILYDRLINEVATGDIVMIWHSDMYAPEGIFETVLKNIKLGKIISLTRIEPPLHPAGPEKIVENFGAEPEYFLEPEFKKYATEVMKQCEGQTTEGIFAPWAIYKEDFQRIGGHDPLYAPQSKEDSDIFNRFILAEYMIEQRWDAVCYHMTCRGSRFNPQLTQIGVESAEWLAQNKRSERNFIRKWGTMVRHDKFLKPIVVPKYKLNFILHNHTIQLLEILEPWSHAIYIDNMFTIKSYIESEQPNTMYDLTKRVLCNDGNLDMSHGNWIIIDGNKLNTDNIRYIGMLHEMIAESGEVGHYNIEDFQLIINDLTTYEHINIYLSRESE